MKSNLLVVELWGLGDLAIATPFLRCASARFRVTLLAKPHAIELSKRFWPEVNVVPFVAPWTAFRRKYRLLNWPWRELFQLLKMRSQNFEVGVSARWDPRDHFLLMALRAQKRVGFPRLGSKLVLTDPLTRPGPQAHRYELWRAVGRALGLELPVRGELRNAKPRWHGRVVVHTGANQPVRVWPLERYRALIARLREQNYRVSVICDPDQKEWWGGAGEPELACPSTVTDLLPLIEGADAFVGNDSGPGHLAATLGLPTFTLFGPQLPELFAPLHPSATWLPGGPCQYKPCSDYCRYTQPKCIKALDQDLVTAEVLKFVARHVGNQSAIIDRRPETRGGPSPA